MEARERYLRLILFCLLWISSTGYHVEVTFLENNVPVETSQFVFVDEERPPFEALEQTESLFESGIRSSTFRVKRSTDAVSGEICVSGNSTAASRNVALVVEKNSEFKLPCHLCNASTDERYKSMQWVKLDYTANADGLYYIHEVVTGMDSEEKKNRVSLTLDHTLSVMKAEPSDAGSYFCKTSEHHSFINKHMKWNDLQEFIVKELHMYFFYHVDVIDLNEHDYTDVSYYSDVSPSGPKVVPELNIEVITQWHPWSPCTVCDAEGTRKRIGLCTVRKYDKRYIIPDKYLNHILTFGEEGLPCQSELLSQFSDDTLPFRPNEVQMDRCLVPCPASRRKRSDSPTEIPKTNYKKKVKKMKVKLGSYLILVCPGSGLMKNVVWMNGTNPRPMKIPKKGTTRVSFDILGNLHFTTAEFGDEGEYSCWISSKRKQSFVVNVVRDNSEDVLKWGKFLGMSFATDLVLFIFLAALKTFTGIAQRRRVSRGLNGDDREKQVRIAKMRGKLKGKQTNNEKVQALKMKLQNK